MIPQIRKYSISALNDTFKASMARISCQAMVLTAGRVREEASLAPVSSLHGMTLSSTCSLSVYPTPLLQFNLHLPSYTSQTLHELHHLALHLLPPTLHSAKLARLFANGIKAPPSPADDDGDIFHEKTTPFDTLEHGKDWQYHAVDEVNVDIPILGSAETVFICKKSQVFEVDLHEIWVVQVLEILSPSSSKPSGGLLYFNRNFHEIGSALLDRRN